MVYLCNVMMWPQTMLPHDIVEKKKRIALTCYKKSKGLSKKAQVWQFSSRFYHIQ